MRRRASYEEIYDLRQSEDPRKIRIVIRWHHGMLHWKTGAKFLMSHCDDTNAVKQTRETVISQESYQPQR